MTLVAVAMATTMNAQYYVGGNLGFGTRTDKTVANTETTKTNFSINPEFGMALNDQLGIGLELSFGTTSNKTEVTGVGSTKSTTTDFGIKPYVRYQALQWGKANIFVDGGLEFATSSAEGMKADTKLGLFVTPGVAFNVSDKWSIVAKLEDVFTFGYHKEAVADVAGAPDAPSSINLGLGTGGFTSGSLRFGVYYNF